MEAALISAGFGLGPLSDANRNKARFTPAVVKYYDLMLQYLLIKPDGTAASGAEISANTKVRWVSSIGDTAAILIDGILSMLLVNCTEQRRYGLGDVADLVITGTVLSDFLAILPLAVHRISLNGLTSTDLENYPADYSVGAPVIQQVLSFPRGSSDLLQFAAGACLAESVAEVTRGPLSYGLCMDGVLLWWNSEFNYISYAENQTTYALYFNPEVRGAIESVYQRYRDYNAAGSIIKPDVLSVLFTSPLFLQGFSSFYLSNDPRYSVKDGAVGFTDIIDGVDLKQAGGAWERSRVFYAM